MIVNNVQKHTHTHHIHCSHLYVGVSWARFMSLGKPEWPKARLVIQKLLSKDEASVIGADRGAYSLSLSPLLLHQHCLTSPPLAITLNFDIGMDDFRKYLNTIPLHVPSVEYHS